MAVYPRCGLALSLIFSLDDFRTLIVQKLVATIRAKELDLFVAQFLVVAIKLVFALRAGHPKYLGHDSSLASKKQNPKSEARNPKQIAAT
jgi:hypothetical protein